MQTVIDTIKITGMSDSKINLSPLLTKILGLPSGYKAFQKSEISHIVSTKVITAKVAHLLISEL